VAYYLWGQIKTAWNAGVHITNLSSNLKYTAIIIAVAFTGASLGLLYNLWRVASLKSQIAKIRGKINRLEK
jgi:TRAP-type C4-dicarboxylate transport system permease small subunit